jgi:hypothetical protein
VKCVLDCFENVHDVGSCYHTGELRNVETFGCSGFESNKSVSQKDFMAGNEINLDELFSFRVGTKEDVLDLFSLYIDGFSVSGLMDPCFALADAIATEATALLNKDQDVAEELLLFAGTRCAVQKASIGMLFRKPIVAGDRSLKVQK